MHFIFIQVSTYVSFLKVCYFKLILNSRCWESYSDVVISECPFDLTDTKSTQNPHYELESS